MKIDYSKRLSALTHSDAFVRNTVLDCCLGFGDTSIDVTKHVINAIDEYGLDEAYEYVHKNSDLDLDEPSADWLIEHMENIDGDTYFGNKSLAHLTSWFVRKAPTTSLEKHRLRIANLPANKQQFSPANIEEELTLRAKFASLKNDEIYDEICSHLAKLDEETEFKDASIPQLERLVRQLSHPDDSLKQKILTNLEKTLPDSELGFRASNWDFGIWVVAAGHLKIEIAIPTILKGMLLDWDWLNETIPEALIKIGTESALKLTADFCLQRQEIQQDDDYDYVRSFLSDVFEKIESPLAAELAHSLLKKEADDYTRINLASAIATQLNSDSISHALEVYEECPDDPERGKILELLYTHAILTDSQPKDLKRWHTKLKREQLRFQQILDRGYSDDSMLAKIMQLQNNSINLPAAHDHLLPFTRTEEKINRNAPCPCGSGKKYKRCCLN